MNEVSKQGLEVLANMIAVEVNRQSSAQHQRNGLTSPLSFREAYDLEHYRRKSMGNTPNTFRSFDVAMKKFLSFLISIGKDNNLELVSVEDVEDSLLV